MKKALITGITGKDGSYLAALLLSKNYEGQGIIRQSSTLKTSRINHLYSNPHLNGVRFSLHCCDPSDYLTSAKFGHGLISPKLSFQITEPR